MKVSVIVSTYNGEKYLLEQLDSIRLQSRAVDEVIISDDHSTDTTCEIIKKYITEHKLEKTWEFIENAVNVGWILNFHRLQYKATGDLIFLCDQDDIWDLDRVDKMVRLMERQGKINVLSSSFRPLFMGNEISLSEFYKRQMINDGKIYKVPFNSKSVYLQSEGCAMCVRRTFLEKIEQYWFEGWAHDEYVWKCAVCIGSVYRYNVANFQRRLHAANVSRQGMKDKEKRLNHLRKEIQSFKCMKLILIENSASEKKISLIQSIIDTLEMRLEMIEKKKIRNLFKLLCRLSFYQNKRSYLAEGKMAFLCLKTE